MIKTTTLVISLIILAQSVPYSRFEKMHEKCFLDTKQLCEINFYANQGAEDSDVVQCAQDYKKAQVCFSSFKQCFPSKGG